MVILVVLVLVLVVYTGSISTHSKSNFVIFSVMDKVFVPIFENYTLAKLEYAKKHNYRYIYDSSAFGFDEKADIHPNFYRIHAALQLLKGTVPGIGAYPADYIVYFDADAFVAEKNLPLDVIIDVAERYVDHFLKLLKYFKYALNGVRTPCHFITQDYPHGINTGFWILKNTTWSVHFLNSWLRESQRSQQYNFSWVYDQGPLMNVILHQAARTAKKSYNDECWQRSSFDHEANLCWDNMLKSFYFPFESRKINHICLLPSSRGIPMRHHMHGVYRKGDFVRHEKGLNAEDINNGGGNLKYEWREKRLIFPNNSVVSRVAVGLPRPNRSKRSFVDDITLFSQVKGLVDRSVDYIGADGARHNIPDSETLFAHGLSLDNVIHVNEEYFDLIPKGNPL